MAYSLLYFSLKTARLLDSLWAPAFTSRELRGFLSVKDSPSFINARGKKGDAALRKQILDYCEQNGFTVFLAGSLALDRAGWQRFFPLTPYNNQSSKGKALWGAPWDPPMSVAPIPGWF
jgi:hypothetical protein